MALTDAALTTLANVKTALGISGSSEDTRLERIIEAASALAANYCSRVFEVPITDDALGTLTEKQAGVGTPFLILNRPPIDEDQSIAVSIDGVTESTSNYEVHDAKGGVLYHKVGTWLITAPAAWGISRPPAFNFPRKLISITYRGGYVTPTQATTYSLTRDLPYDLEQAAIMLAVSIYNSEGRDQTISNESLMSYSVSYGAVGVGTSAKALLRKLAPSAALILDHYDIGGVV